jgi:RNA polymerase sigma-70 factor (ECF subfamily)
MNDSAAKVNPEEWLDLYGDSLFSYAMMVLRNRERAEEVVQETFVSALKKLEQFQGKGSQGAWLMGILKRKVIDHLRKLSKQPASLEAEDAVVSSLFDRQGQWSRSAKATSGLSLDRLEAEEFREVFEKCFKGLPDTQAATFQLKEIEQKSSEEVCKLLEISSSNLWVLMHRARLRLAECIKARWAMGDA